MLQHSLAAGLLVEPLDDPVLHLAALTHDMEEMATGDIPAPFKAKDQRVLGGRIRDWMYKAVFNQPVPDPRTVDLIKDIDEALKFAEMLCLNHPRAMFDPYFFETARAFIEVGDEVQNGLMIACDAVWGLIDIPEHEAVMVFEDQVTALLQTSQLKAQENRA